MNELKAKNIRKGRKKRDREPCFVCGKHRSITQEHHILPLKHCAEILNRNIAEKIDVPLIWLCPNCHAYVHKLIKLDFISVMRETRIFHSISENDLSALIEIGRRAEAIESNLLSKWIEEACNS